MIVARSKEGGNQKYGTENSTEKFLLSLDI